MKLLHKIPVCGRVTGRVVDVEDGKDDGHIRERADRNAGDDAKGAAAAAAKSPKEVRILDLVCDKMLALYPMLVS